MFKTWPNLSSTQLQDRSCARIQSLATFSESCLQHGVHPAQGLRLVKRHFAKEFHQLKLTPSDAAADLLAQKVHALVSKSPSLRAKCLPCAKPEHFALNTCLPNNLNSVKGYVLPTQDIHPDIHFIRTQRRYNKRRYTRVRAVSRPSF
jgi:hypothetical protein